MKKVFVIVMCLIVAMVGTVLVVVGCSSSPTPEEAKAQLETDLQNLKDSLTTLLNPSTYSSSDAFNKAADDIQKSFNAVVESAKQVKDVETADLSKAWDDLDKAITSDQPLLDKLNSIQVAATQFQEAWQKLYYDVTKELQQ